MDSVSQKILEIYEHRRCLSLNQLGAILNQSPLDLADYVLRLQKKEYLQIERNEAMLKKMDKNSPIEIHTPFEITIDGRAALEDAHRIEKQKRNDLIRYIITTGIAVAAFIKSFFF